MLKLPIRLHGNIEDATSTGFQFADTMGVKYVASVLGAILVLLLLAALIVRIYIACNSYKYRNPQSEEETIVKMSRNLVARLSIFVALYCAMILLSAAFVIGMFYLTFFLIGAIINGYFVFLVAGGLLSIGIDIALFIAFAGLWTMSIVSFQIMVRPFLQFFGKMQHSGVELDPQKNQKLYNLIIETARESGVEAPSKIFVDWDVNAGVCFEESVKSIFRPGRKTLTIGLPLFTLFSVQELKAILAHEFGHFAQKQMRIIAAAANSCRLIQGVLNGDNVTNVRLNKWVTSDNVLWRNWGIRTVRHIDRIRKMMYSLFCYVIRADNELRRIGEVDADRMSARVAGTEHAVSARYKMPIIINLMEDFRWLVSHYIDDKNRKPKSVSATLFELESFLQNRNDCKVATSDVLSSPVVRAYKTQVSVDDMWRSHPADDLRIDVIKEIDSKVTNVCNDPASFLLTADLKTLLDNFFSQHVEESVETVSNDEFVKWAKNEYGERTFPREFSPFLARCIYLSSDKLLREPLELPDAAFEMYQDVVFQYIAADKDMERATNFMNKSDKSRYIIYKGKRHTRRTLPMAEIDAHFKEMLNHIIEADIAFYCHALAVAGEESERVRVAYTDILYSQDFRQDFAKAFQSSIEYLHSLYSTASIVPDERREGLIASIERMETDMKKFMVDADIVTRLAPVLHHESYQMLCDYLEKRVSLVSLDDFDYIQNILMVYDSVIGWHNDLEYFCKKNVATILEGEKPVSFWDNSIAEKRHQASAPLTQNK